MSSFIGNLVESHGKTQYKVSKDTGIPQASMSDYMRGKTKPTLKNVIKLSEYFGISIEELVRGCVEDD